MADQYPASARKCNLFAVLILFLLCVISYSNTLNNGFLLDDHVFLVGDKTLEDASIKTLFSWGFKTNYRPIVYSFLKIELMLFGDSPTGYHLVNIFLFFFPERFHFSDAKDIYARHETGFVK